MRTKACDRFSLLEEPPSRARGTRRAQIRRAVEMLSESKASENIRGNRLKGAPGGAASPPLAWPPAERFVKATNSSDA